MITVISETGAISSINFLVSFVINSLAIANFYSNYDLSSEILPSAILIVRPPYCFLPRSAATFHHVQMFSIDLLCVRLDELRMM